MINYQVSQDSGEYTNPYMKLLVTGCQRSGTTLLASMLGRHCEINMLNEAADIGVVDRLIGKQYQGLKSCIFSDISYNKRRTRISRTFFCKVDFIRKLINRRLLNPMGLNIHVRGYSCVRIKDFVEDQAKIIVIFRVKEQVIRSILNRTTLTSSQAAKEYQISLSVMQKLIAMGAHQVHYEELVLQPVRTLNAICDYLDIAYDKRMLEGPMFNSYYPHQEILTQKAI